MRRTSYMRERIVGQNAKTQLPERNGLVYQMVSQIKAKQSLPHEVPSVYQFITVHKVVVIFELVDKIPLYDNSNETCVCYQNNLATFGFTFPRTNKFFPVRLLITYFLIYESCQLLAFCINSSQKKFQRMTQQRQNATLLQRKLKCENKRKNPHRTAMQNENHGLRQIIPWRYREDREDTAVLASHLTAQQKCSI